MSMIQLIKRNLKPVLFGLIATIIFVAGVFSVVRLLPTEQPMGGEMLGASFPDSNWYMVNSFQGYQTKADATKLSAGANPNGQNTIINDGDRISARNFGYEIIGTNTTTEDSITSLHTFRKRNGDNILMRSRGTYLEYFEESNDIWESLRTTSTDDAVYGYADYNINTDLRSYVYFGNAVDNFARWTGAHSVLTSAVAIGTTTIHVSDTTDLLSSGTIRFCDTNVAYSSKTSSTVTISASAVTCTSTRSVTQAVEEFAANPKGNIYLNQSNRLFIAGVTTTPQAVYFSAYGDPETYLTTLVLDGTDKEAGIFNLGEGGGGVTGMTQDEGSIYFFKKNITYKVTLSDSFYTLAPLKPFDGKSQTTGNTNNKLVFTGANGTYFVTPDNQIMALSRVQDYDYPQITPISYNIQPTVDGMDFSSGSGIFWKQSAFFSAKSTSDSYSPDVVLVYNSVISAWESPIIGWSASDFTIYDDGDGEALYFGDANTANVYKVIPESNDNNLAFTSSWRSKQFTFGDVGPISTQKEMDSVYVEGYISDNTEITISLLLNEDGYTQSFSTTIDGATDTNLIYNSSPYNVFGLHPFGFLRFGSADAVGLKKFRVYLSKDFRALPLYNAQIEFGSSSSGQSWEITSFGFKVRRADMDEQRNLYKSFK